LFDRHVHKTGGSTMRQIFLANDRHDAWVYWGYSMMQFMGVATRLTQLLLGNSAKTMSNRAAHYKGQSGCAFNGTLRVIGENHYTRWPTESFLSRLGPTSPLAQVPPMRAVSSMRGIAERPAPRCR